MMDPKKTLMTAMLVRPEVVKAKAADIGVIPVGPAAEARVEARVESHSMGIALRRLYRLYRAYGLYRLYRLHRLYGSYLPWRTRR